MDEKISPKIVGTEFYFDDLEQAKRFYSGILAARVNLRACPWPGAGRRPGRPIIGMSCG